ncbi:hypothetical protein EAF04_001278 [Stromatinia cepivora]|nr:hypothetical protein EAF04_001278 [Stromatinia cepivora]
MPARFFQTSYFNLSPWISNRKAGFDELSRRSLIISTVFLARRNLQRLSGVIIEIYLVAQFKLVESAKERTTDASKRSSPKSKEKTPEKCRDKHLYWPSRILTKSCTNMGKDGQPDPIIEWPPSSAPLEKYLFLRKTVPDPAGFPYRKKGPAQSWKVVRGLHTDKERIDIVVPEDDKNEQKGPFDHDALIVQPSPMALHNDASKKAQEAFEKAQKAASESVQKLARLLRRNRYKSARDEKNHRIQDQNAENPYAPARRDDEGSMVTDSDFAGNDRERNAEDDEPAREKKARVRHRHQEYVRAKSVRSDSSHSGYSDSEMSSAYAPSVRRIYEKGSRRHRRHRGHGHGHGYHSRPFHCSSDTSSDTGRPPSVYSYPSPHYTGFRYR